MKKASFTTSSKATMADSVTVHSTETTSLPTSKTRDFLLLCRGDNAAEAVHALYFLPANYKLMVVTSDTNRETWTDATPFQDRIQFETSHDMGISGQESPFSVDAVIFSDTSVSIPLETAPYIMVSASADSGISAHGSNGFQVQSGNPEALASAILRIARKGQ